MIFENLTPSTIGDVLTLVPLDVQEQMHRENIVLAGGAIRDTVAGLSVKDIDIFCHSKEQAKRLAYEYAGPYMYVPHTTFAYSVNLDGALVQYVYYKEFADMQELIGQFDFRACCAGIRWVSEQGRMEYGRFGGYWEGAAVRGFYEDCLSKALRFMSQVKDAGKLTALGRALQLAKRGWDLPTDEAAAIVTHWQPTLDVVEVRRSFRPHYGRV